MGGQPRSFPSETVGGVRRLSVFALLTVGTLAWGALAFGAVYRWAYQPLLMALFALGSWGLRPVGSPRRVNRNLTIGLLILVGAVGLQLIPVPRDTLAAISPSTDSLLRAYDLAYARLSTSDERVGHASSILPEQTRSSALRAFWPSSSGAVLRWSGLVMGFSLVSGEPPSRSREVLAGTFTGWRGTECRFRP